MGTFRVKYRQAELFQMVLALSTASCLTSGLNRGQKQGNQDPDNRNWFYRDFGTGR